MYNGGRPARALALCAMTLVLLGSGLLGAVTRAAAAKAPARFVLAGRELKTIPIQHAIYDGFQDRLDALDKASDSEALRKRYQEIRVMADSIRIDALVLAKTLKANKEIDDFNQLVMEKALAESKVLAASIKNNGGAYQMLTQAGSLIDRDMADLQTELKLSDSGSLLDFFVTPAQAGILHWVRTQACYGFWFTISLGYATDHAHTSCDN